MSAEPQATLPQALRDLSGARRRSPAEQEDAVRDRRPGGADRAYYEDVIKLPGFDAQPQRCVPLKPVGFCEHHGHPVLGRSSCQTRGCPEHWKDWLKRNVVNGVARLAAYRHSREGWEKRMVHAMFSPDLGRIWDADAVFETRSEAYDVAGEVGVRGGVCYTHPYRSSEWGDALFETAVDHGEWEKERGKWSFFRQLAGDDWDAMKRYAEAEPHYHTLAGVEDFDVEAAPEGWVAKNIRSMPRFHIDDVESYRPMARVIWYLLTHSASMQGRQSVTYFGEVHPAAFNPEEELSAGEWSKIQRMAERAISTEPGGVPRETGVETMECPRDGCASLVIPIYKLSDYMIDSEWWESIGATERNQLRAIDRWWYQKVTKPPPRLEGSEELVLEWLAYEGRLVLDAPRAPGGAQARQQRFRSG